MYYDPQEQFAFITANGDADLTVISLSLPASRFEWARTNGESLHPDFANKIPEMKERLKNAERVSPMYGVSPRKSFYRQPYGEGWVLVGDAGYYKDPLPGQGIYDALRSAELTAEAFTEYRRNGSTDRAWENAFKKYQRARDRETKAMYTLTDFYADLTRARPPYVMDLFRAIADSPEWSNRYVSLFNGVTPVDWFLRTDTTMRIYWGWRWRQFKRRFWRADAPPTEQVL
jgi:flavin-dependent dehydrogenase